LFTIDCDDEEAVLDSTFRFLLRRASWRNKIFTNLEICNNDVKAETLVSRAIKLNAAACYQLRVAPRGAVVLAWVNGLCK
jgi:hypothetical protein